MLKKGLCLMLFLTVMSTTNPVAASTALVTIKLNGSYVSLNNSPFLFNNRILVPSELVRKLGATIEWKADTKSIVISLKDSESNNKKVYLKTGQAVALVDGVEIKQDVAPIIKKGVSFVPLKLIADCMGARVKWEGKGKTGDIIYIFPNKDQPPQVPSPWKIQVYDVTTNNQEEVK